MQEILANTPPDLRPKADADWYKYTWAKYVSWVKQQMVGMTFEGKIPLGRCYTFNGSGRTDGQPWMVYGYFGKQTFTYFGTENSWQVHFPLRNMDETAARRWEKLKPGVLLPVRGVIKIVSLETWDFGAKLPRITYMLELKDIEVDLPGS